MAERPKVVIHTDGACSGNPGPGGWGVILELGSHRKELKGGETLTTNNRMELTAAIEALEALKSPSDVDLYTDFELSPRRHHQLDQGLEEERLAHRRQEAGEERRIMGAAGASHRTARRALALGQGPCRP